MSSLRDVFAVLEQMQEQRVLHAYAIGGATAVLFYAEPTRTYDVDVFVTMSGPPDLASLAPVYAWARAQGVPHEGEHLVVHGVPVQILPAYNALVEEAIAEGRTHDYEGTPVRVVGPEHLVALALQAGGGSARGSCCSSAEWIAIASVRFWTRTASHRARIALCAPSSSSTVSANTRS